MAMNYVVTAQKPTAVTHAVIGKFADPNKLSLIIAKNTILEVFSVEYDGKVCIKSMKEFNIFGRIAGLKLFEFDGYDMPLLFFVTQKYHVAFVEASFSPGSDGQLRLFTRAHGNVRERVGRPADTGIYCTISSDGSLIALRLIEGSLKLISVKASLNSADGVIESFSVRLEEYGLIDIQFLYGPNSRTLAILHQDNVTGNPKLKIYEFCIREKDIRPSQWDASKCAIDVYASHIIPTTFEPYGCLIVGEESITYFSSENDCTKIVTPFSHLCSINCWCRIDETRFILGDRSGHLFVLILSLNTVTENDKEKIKLQQLRIDYLGETTLAEVIVPLIDSTLFIGSRLGDSQVVKLTSSLEFGKCVQVLEGMSNIGPISDMCLIVLDGQSQGLLVTCSGAHKEGSLRFLRNGIGIDITMSFVISDVKNIFPISLQGHFHDYILFSFMDSSKGIILDDSENESMELSALNFFDCNNRTLLCNNVGDGLLLQVTTAAVILISAMNGTVVNCWSHPQQKPISLAACNRYQCVIAVASELFYFEITNSLNEISCVRMPHNIACVDISPLQSESMHSHVCAVGLWVSCSAHIVSLPQLEILASAQLGTTIPRSILLANFEGIYYLIVAMGDGILIYFTISPENYLLHDGKRIVLGSRPMNLNFFNSRGQLYVFACSDYPVVIYSSNYKIVFSNINIRDVTYMCSINSAKYRDMLLILSDNELKVGSIDEVQKLHVRSLKIGETPRRIAYHSTSSMLGVLVYHPIIDMRAICGGNLIPAYNVKMCASRMAKAIDFTTSLNLPSNLLVSDPTEFEEHSVVLVDKNRLEFCSSCHLLSNEHGCSIVVMRFKNDPVEYLVVGTAFILPDEAEPTRGRLIVFRIEDSVLIPVTEYLIDGAPFSLVELEGHLLVAINSKLRLFSLSSDKKLSLIAEQYNNTLALYLKAKNGFVIVGDLIRSISLYTFNPNTCKLDEIARDHNPNWMTAVEILDEDNFLGAENYFNLFCCQKDSAAIDEERRMMKEVSMFHIGEFVNVIVNGTLINKQQETDIFEKIHSEALIGSVSGYIGQFMVLKDSLYPLLFEIQKRLQLAFKSIGYIEHAEWRSFESELKIETCSGYIDGDLIESLLEMPRYEVFNYLRDLDVGKYQVKEENDVLKVIHVIEDMYRLH